MDSIKAILKEYPNVNDENKDKYINVYDENVARRIQDAIDKPRAIGQILTEKLGAPENLLFYIKLAYQYPEATLFECVSLTNDAEKRGKIKGSRAQYFYGIVRRQKK